MALAAALARAATRLLRGGLPPSAAYPALSSRSRLFCSLPADNEPSAPGDVEEAEAEILRDVKPVVEKSSTLTVGRWENWKSYPVLLPRSRPSSLLGRGHRHHPVAIPPPAPTAAAAAGTSRRRLNCSSSPGSAPLQCSSPPSLAVLFRRYEDGGLLSPDDEKFIVEKVLAHHPRSQDKIGCGLEAIMVNKHPGFRRSRCLFVVRTNGELEDFSYRKCLRNFHRKGLPVPCR